MRKSCIALVAALFAATAASAQEGAVARLSGPIPASQYPLALGERPLVLPNFMLEGTTQFEHFRAPGGSESGIGLRAGFGIGDLAQIDAVSSILVDPSSEWSKVIAARVAFLAYDSRELDIAPSVYLPFDFHDGADLLSRGNVGAETRYLVNRMFYVYGLRDLVNFGFGKAFGNELNLGLNGTFGLGIEPIEHVSLEVDATFFHLKVAGAGEKSTGIFADNIPVAVKALFAVNRQLDVFATVQALDLKNGFDTLTFVGGLNARL